MSPFLRITLLLLLVAVSMVYGMVSYSHELPPYPLVERLHNDVLRMLPHEVAAAVGPVLRPEAPLRAEDIRFASVVEAERLRRDLIGFIWGTPALPSRRPAVVDSGFSDADFDGMAGLREIRRLTVRMDYGLQSYPYHFVAGSPNGRLVLYHHGHGTGFDAARTEIAAFVGAGYDVVAFSMPLEGANVQEDARLAEGGTVRLANHDDFALLAPARGHSIRYFLEPVVVALNHVLAGTDYSDVAMVGLSGGGWTTTIAAALDPRIRASFPVAGSYPLYLRRLNGRDRGDWEQQLPELYQERANYLELYALGSFGEGRMQLQILNRDDPCCFSGNAWLSYRGPVREHVERLGAGEFDVFQDDTHALHQISPAALQRILSALDRR